MESADDRAPLAIGGGKYVLFDRLAAGGMGSVHIGRMHAPGGFGRLVAIKRLHPHLAIERELREAFVDEARTASRVQHANVAQMLDVVVDGDEVFLVMELVHGAALSSLLLPRIRAGERVPLRVALGVMSQVLQGLHAAHTAADEVGAPIHIIHRDVSPQNILVGSDGIARVIDFGVAKAKGRMVTTEDGSVKGKLSYMAPEYVAGHEVTGSADVFSASVVLWELLAGKRMYESTDERQIVFMVIHGAIRRLGKVAPDVPPEVEAVVTRGLSMRPEERYASAMEMAVAIEATGHCATTMEIGQWVRGASETLASQRALIARVEATLRDPPSLAPRRGAATRATAPTEPEPDLTPLLMPTPERDRTAGDAKRRRVWPWAVAAGLMVAAGAGTWAFWQRSSNRPLAPPPTVAMQDEARPAPPSPTAAPPPASASTTPVLVADAPHLGSRPSSRGKGPAARPAPRPTSGATSGGAAIVAPVGTHDGLFPRN